MCGRSDRRTIHANSAGVSLMRIFLATVVVLLGANFAIELMNSNMVDLMEERKEQMERAIDRM